MKKLLRSLKWIDDNLIRLMVVVFIFLIPLYPKFPIRIIDYTYIAVRVEDIYIGLLLVVFLVQLIRKKIQLRTDFWKLFALFWGAVSLSFVVNAYGTGTIIYKHLGFLHAARRFEYMVIFFIAASSVRSWKHFKTYLYLIISVVFIAAVYGIGQKYAGWPAVQTMNPEFAKGHLLYLTPEARVSSTFAGHYDLAAYLVLTIPMILGLYFSKYRKMLFVVFVTTVLTLMLTASRISYIAYIVSTFGLLIFLRKYKYLIGVAILTAVLTFLSSNLTSRFLKTVQVRQIFVNEKTGQVVVPQKTSSKELPAGTYYIPIKDQTEKSAQQTKENEQLVQQKIIEDLQSEASRSGRILTSSEAAQLAATAAANLKPVNTVISDISFATRLQVEWPRAVQAFLKDPILGTGPSSITESTDNDYLRWIGEFGALGTGAFLWILLSIGKRVWDKSRKLEPGVRVIYTGFLFGLAGLMMNASYIDVFEASKVAYTFWLIAGIFVASLYYAKPKNS